MRKAVKVVIPAVILISVVLIAVFFMRVLTPTPTPDFRVYNIYGVVQGPTPMYRKFYLIFDIDNNGTSAASNITGTAKYWEDGEWTAADWLLTKYPNMLEVNETCRECWARFQCSFEPSKEFIITVSCDEGVLREFNVTIP